MAGRDLLRQPLGTKTAMSNIMRKPVAQSNSATELLDSKPNSVSYDETKLSPNTTANDLRMLTQSNPENEMDSEAATHKKGKGSMPNPNNNPNGNNNNHQGSGSFQYTRPSSPTAGKASPKVADSPSTIHNKSEVPTIGHRGTFDRMRPPANTTASSTPATGSGPPPRPEVPPPRPLHGPPTPKSDRVTDGPPSRPEGGPPLRPDAPPPRPDGPPPRPDAPPPKLQARSLTVPNFNANNANNSNTSPTNIHTASSNNITDSNRNNPSPLVIPLRSPHARPSMEHLISPKSAEERTALNSTPPIPSPRTEKRPSLKQQNSRTKLTRTIAYDHEFSQSDSPQASLPMSPVLRRSLSLPCIRLDSPTLIAKATAINRRGSADVGHKKLSGNSSMGSVAFESDICSPDYEKLVFTTLSTPYVNRDKASEVIEGIVLTHQLFISSPGFLRLLREAYSASLSAEELKKVHQSVFLALCKFIQLDFWNINNRSIVKEMQTLISKMKANGQSAWVSDLERLKLNQTKKDSHDASGNDGPSFRNLIDDVPPLVLAQQLSLFFNDKWKELKMIDWILIAKSKPSAAFTDSVERSQQISNWLSSQILSCPDLKARSARLQKVIELAKVFQDMKNYELFHSTMFGLSSSAVRRLKTTWKQLNTKTAKQFQTLELSASEESLSGVSSLESISHNLGAVPPLKALSTVFTKAIKAEQEKPLRDQIAKAVQFLSAINRQKSNSNDFPVIQTIQKYLLASINSDLDEKELGQLSLFCEPDSGYKKEIEKILSVLQRVTAKSFQQEDVNYLLENLSRLSQAELKELQKKAHSSQGLKSLFGKKSDKPLQLQLSKYYLDFGLRGKKAFVYSTCKDSIQIGNPNKTDINVNIVLLGTTGKEKCKVSFIPASATIPKAKGIEIELDAIMITPDIVELLVCVEIVGNCSYLIPLHIEGKALTETNQEIPWEYISGGKLIGQGAAGAVYKTEWPAGRNVAVKRFTVNEVGEADLKEFLTEVTLLAKLHHPNVVNFIGACSQFPNLALVMEFVPHGSLASVLQNKNLELSWALRAKFALDGARGLAFLHELNILHRDLKSDNMLVSSLDSNADVNLKVTDFSISREVEAAKYEDDIKYWDFTTPEIMKGDPPTRASDVFSFGVILWELAVREIPWTEIKWGHQVETVVLAGKRPAIPANLWIPPEYLQLMQICWSQDPSKRLSFKDVVSALRYCQMQQQFASFKFDGINLKDDEDDEGEAE